MTPSLGPRATRPSKLLRDLADAYDADLLTYGPRVAIDILVSDLATLEGDIAAVAAEESYGV